MSSSIARLMWMAHTFFFVASKSDAFDKCASDASEYRKRLDDWNAGYLNHNLHVGTKIGKMSNKFPSPKICGSYNDISIMNPRMPNHDTAQSPVILFQSDFDQGTFIISRPGLYLLGEDIIFEPNPEDDWSPRPDQQDKYPGAFAFSEDRLDGIGPYAMGFFASIVVASDDVVIDLMGYTTKQSETHALQQRFHSIIELGSSPFIPKQGPANFGTDFVSVNRCTISNGTLGRSSHHGIHGNLGQDLRLSDLIIENWEVASIALNGFRRVKVANVIARMHNDIPVMSTYSQIRFIRKFVRLTKREDVLRKFYERHRYTSKLATGVLEPVHFVFANSHRYRAGEKLDAEIILRGFDEATRPILEEAVAGFPEGWKEKVIEHHPRSAFLINREGKIDGTPYGMLIGMGGAQVHNFKSLSDTDGMRSTDVFLKNITFHNIHARVNEVIGLSTRVENGERRVTQADFAGAIFVFGNDFGVTDEEGYYKGNVLSDAHIYLNPFTPDIKSIHEKINKTDSLLTIPNILLEKWALQGSKSNDEIVKESQGQYKFACGWDDMRHTIKGLIGLRIEAVDRMRVEDVIIEELINSSPISSHKHCGSHEYTVNSRSKTVHEDIAPTTFGFVVAASNNVQVRNSYVRVMKSINGDVITWSTSRTESTNVELDVASVFDAMCIAPSASNTSRVFPNKQVVRAFPFEFSHPLDNTNGAGLSFCFES
eukprot:gene202-352_t